MAAEAPGMQIRGFLHEQTLDTVLIKVRSDRHSQFVSKQMFEYSFDLTFC